ncbi:ABC transporter permease [Rhodococcus aetherivorans]
MTAVISDRTEPLAAGAGGTVLPPAPGRTARRRVRGTPTGLVLGATLLAVVVGVSLAAPALFPDGYDVQDLGARSLPPTWFGEHPLGTDHLGRDYLTRLAYGGRSALVLSAIAVVVSTAIGVALAFASVLSGTWLEVIVDRIADVQLALPSILVGIVVLALLGPSTWTLLAVLAVSSWVLTFRVVRNHARSLLHRPYIDACRLAGGTTRDVIVRHLLPNTAPLVLVSASLNFAQIVLLLSGFGFIGLGIQPPAPDWGQLVAAGQAQLANQWWLAILPGLALVALLVGIQLVADWISARFAVTTLERNLGQ